MVDVRERGAYACILKPFDNHDLLDLLHGAVRCRERNGREPGLKEECTEVSGASYKHYTCTDYDQPPIEFESTPTDLGRCRS